MGKPMKVKARDPVTGKYAFDGDHDRLCHCGHRLGVHIAGGFECINGERGAGGSGEPCSCDRFRPAGRAILQKEQGK